MGRYLRQNLEIDEKHIDEYGHVNYKSHPLLLEKFQDEYMKEVVGLSFSEIENRFGLLSIVRKMNVDYSGQLHRGDLLEVTTGISNIGSTSFTLSQEILNKGMKVTSLDMVVVMCDKVTSNKSIIPEELRERLSR
ncbi:MAG: thioesterase family protein [Nanoarchaeota archaeon]